MAGRHCGELEAAERLGRSLLVYADVGQTLYIPPPTLGTLYESDKDKLDAPSSHLRRTLTDLLILVTVRWADLLLFDRGFPHHVGSKYA